MVSFDFNAFVAQTSEKLKSPEVQLASAGIVGTVTAVQLFTDWNPLGRCFVFWKQLRAHVSLRTAKKQVGDDKSFPLSLSVSRSLLGEKRSVS